MFSQVSVCTKKGSPWSCSGPDQPGYPRIKERAGPGVPSG